MTALRWVRLALLFMFALSGIAALGAHDVPVAFLLFAVAYYLERLEAQERRW